MMLEDDKNGLPETSKDNSRPQYEESKAKAHFIAPIVQHNPWGWGPCNNLPDHLKNMPYQPFSKDDRIGKICDWTGPAFQDKETTFIPCKGAAYDLKKTVDMENYPAAQQYIRNKMKIYPNFDTIRYLLGILDKQKILPETYKQMLLVDIGLFYLLREDFKNSSKYFVDCLSIDPKSMILKEFSPLDNPGATVNIYKILDKQLIPSLRRLKNMSTLDDETSGLYDKLITYYNENIENLSKLDT